ncbi:MAG TPA: DUF4410 domain-containing protein [Nitrospirota bacterium]|nr:DUF4410 domain-containing protein [Nitrospirota bacterium]
MKRFLAVTVSALILIPTFALAKLNAPDVMDTEKIITEESLAKYKNVGVRIFSTDGIDYSNVDDEEMKKMKRFMKDCQEKLAKTIKNNLEDEGVNAFVIEEDADAGKADMVVEGKFTKIDLGSAVGRIMWGWGAGQAGLTVEGRLVDAKSGDALAKFEHENTSGLGDGEKWSLILREAQDLGDKIAEFIVKLRK